MPSGYVAKPRNRCVPRPNWHGAGILRYPTNRWLKCSIVRRSPSEGVTSGS
jgi:hypothetical protein